MTESEKAVMRQALATLKNSCDFIFKDVTNSYLRNQAIAALEAAIAQPVQPAVSDTPEWKLGNELLPFHPDASHIKPDYRDGWNACYAASRFAIEQPEQQTDLQQQNQQLRDQNTSLDLRCAEYEKLLHPAQLAATDWNSLTDIDRQQVFESLPDMLDGFLKTWGWLHFAKGIELKCREKNIAQSALWQPEFDAASLEQQDLAIQFCIEIAGLRGKSGSPPDPIRLLEMAQALYEAERDSFSQGPVL